MKKIAIDCRYYNSPGGIGRYTRAIVESFVKRHSNDKYYLLTSNLHLPQYAAMINTKKIILSKNLFIYKFIETPLALKKEKIDIYLSPTQELPLFKPKGCRYVCIVPDIAFERHLSWFSFPVKLLTLFKVYEKSLKIADLILTISDFTKTDIINKYHIDPKKIKVFYLGVESIFRKITKQRVQKYLTRKFKLESEYIFYVDTVRAKNLLIAFSELVKNEWSKNNIKLVCLGKFVDENQHPKYLAKKLGTSNRVVCINKHVSDQDLCYLYNGAKFFISPSYYEGFGLTPLEALKCGTPVLISNIPSHKEIFLTSATYCDPYDYEDIKVKMRYLYNRKITNSTIKMSNQILKRYNWKIITRQIYKYVAKDY